MKIKIQALRDSILGTDGGCAHEFKKGQIYEALQLRTCVHIYPEKDVLVRINSDKLIAGNGFFKVVVSEKTNSRK